jgi:pSer/pThr/pTyr-binding forkhead associated (FHA) protein
MKTGIALKAVLKYGIETWTRVTKPRFVVGRAPDCDLTLNSPFVSRHHFALIVNDDTVVLQDLGSLNGTYVNGQRVQDQCPLDNGDAVAVGNRRYQILIANAPTLPVSQSDKSGSDSPAIVA